MVTPDSRRGYFVAKARAGLGPVLLSGAIALGAAPEFVRADTIVLRGGGQVQGKVLPDPQNENRLQVWLLQGRKPLSFLKAQIVEVIPKSSPLDDYFEKSKKAPQTVQAQYDLGAWCEQNKLVDLAKLHYESALTIDKSFEPAHRKLGHVFHDGYWLSRDDRRSPGSGQVQGTLDLHRRESQEDGRGRNGSHADLLGPQDQDLATGDRQRPRRSPARGGDAVDGDPG